MNGSDLLGLLEDDELKLAARLHVPVLITAENDRARANAAHFLHLNGVQAKGPFVSSAGRDTDDDVALRCMFEEAHGGTLFIDDIVKLTTKTQMELFALLGESLEPQSSSEAQPARVRLITGASRHFAAEHAIAAFSEPLFFRLNMIHVDLISGHLRARHPNPYIA
jgi:DNA-binding NtrC family response regulator